MDGEGAPHVQAAGGVIWRRAGDDLEILVVHRPRYDDWTFPKGKLEPGEDHEQGAHREVLEETGLTVDLGAELEAAHYVDHKGRPKTVRYWAMTVVGGEFEANDEVDALEWLPRREVARRLSYRRDADVLDSFVAIIGRVPHG